MVNGISHSPASMGTAIGRFELTILGSYEARNPLLSRGMEQDNYPPSKLCEVEER